MLPPPAGRDIDLPDHGLCIADACEVEIVRVAPAEVGYFDTAEVEDAFAFSVAQSHRAADDPAITAESFEDRPARAVGRTGRDADLLGARVARTLGSTPRIEDTQASFVPASLAVMIARDHGERVVTEPRGFPHIDRRLGYGPQFRGARRPDIKPPPQILRERRGHFWKPCRSFGIPAQREAAFGAPHIGN